ncbi:MAG: hypothetical protein ACUVX9_11815 [Anaerolineae bacterium]
MPWWERLLSLAYWVGTDAGPLSPTGRALHVASALGFLGLAGWSLRACRRQGLLLWRLSLGTCILGLGAVAARLAGLSGWGVRLWVVVPMLSAIGLATAPWWLLPAWPDMRRAWAVFWSFLPLDQALPAVAVVVLASAHLTGLALVSRLLGGRLWLAPVLWLAAVLPALVARRPGVAIVSLMALLPAYLAAAWLVVRQAAWLLGVLAPAEPVALWPLLVIGIGFAWAYQLASLLPQEHRGALSLALPAGLAGLTLCWSAWCYLVLYARGVTATDPFCYVQMAVDVMRHGSAVHAFPLAAQAWTLQLPAAPFVHLGYHSPFDAAGRAITVWPAGHAVLLGLAGRLAGEPAIYWTTPVLGLAAAAATFWLALLLLGDLDRPWRLLAGALAALLVATSHEQVRWLLVHMADISAELFSVLAVALAWQAARHRRVWLAAVAGLALALAYWVRHTQLAMMPAALAALLLVRPAAPLGTKHASDSERPGHASSLLCIAAFLGAAFLGALPDLAYHARYLGSPFRPESEELALYALRAVPGSTAMLAKGFFGRAELGFLVPFLLVGAVAMARRNRPGAVVVALWLLGLWAVQAPYSALRPRDLLPALPALALLASYGVAVTLPWLAARTRPMAVLLALFLPLLLWARSGGTLLKPITRDFDNFGYLWPGQVAEFAALQRLTPAGAIVGSSFNTGPIELYGQRAAFRPAELTPAELERWLHAQWASGRPVYLLDDGDAMPPVLDAVAGYARLVPCAVLQSIPHFNLGAGSELRDVTLYRIEP